MPKVEVVLDEEEIVVALQALRDFSDRLAEASRHRRTANAFTARSQQLVGRALKCMSEAYMRMEI